MVATEILPRGYSLGWEGLSYDESRKGNEAVYSFLVVVAFVYLVLVAQYESFDLPLAVLLSLPIGVFGSFLFLKLMGLSNDVYAQIGLIMVVQGEERRKARWTTVLGRCRRIDFTQSLFSPVFRPLLAQPTAVVLQIDQAHLRLRTK